MPDDVDLFSVMPTPMLVFGGIVMVVVLAVFATVIVKGVGRWTRNNASPVVTTMARVVAKRSEDYAAAARAERVRHTSRPSRHRRVSGASCPYQRASLV